MLMIKHPLRITNSGDTDSLLHLKSMAWICVGLQYWAAIIYLFCMLMVPESNDAAVMCGVVAVLVSLIPVFYALYHRRLPLTFSCISIFNLAPIWFLYLESILPGYDAYVYITPALRIETFFWVAVFLLFVNLLYIFFWKSVSSFSVRSFSLLNAINLKPVVYQRATIACFVFPLIALLYFYQSFDLLWVALTAGRSEAGESLRESLGTSSGYIVPISSVWQLTPLLGSIAFFSSKNKFQPLSILAFLLGLMVCFVYFLSGSRGIMMFVIAPVLFFLFYYNWDRGIKFWIIATAILFVLIGIMEMQVRFRGNLLDVIVDPERAAVERGLVSATTFDPTQSHRDNNMYLLCLMVQGYPTRYSFQGFNEFFAILLNPIPRAIWPSKPVLAGAKDISQQAAFVFDGPLYMGTTSLTFSIVGEAYQAGGTLGLLVYSVFYSLFLLFFDGITYYSNRDQPISVGLLGLGVFLSFWGFRALFALISFSYPIIILILLLKLIQFLRPNANHIHST